MSNNEVEYTQVTDHQTLLQGNGDNGDTRGPRKMDDEGMSTGAKAGIGGGIVATLLLLYYGVGGLMGGEQLLGDSGASGANGADGGALDGASKFDDYAGSEIFVRGAIGSNSAKPNGVYREKTDDNGKRYWHNDENNCSIYRQGTIASGDKSFFGSLKSTQEEGTNWYLACNGDLCLSHSTTDDRQAPPHKQWNAAGCTGAAKVHYVQAQVYVENSDEPSKYMVTKEKVMGKYQEMGLRGAKPWYQNEHGCEMYYATETQKWEFWCFTDTWCHNIVPLFASGEESKIPPKGVWEAGSGRSIIGRDEKGPTVYVKAMPVPAVGNKDKELETEVAEDKREAEERKRDEELKAKALKAVADAEKAAKDAETKKSDDATTISA